MIAFCKVVAKQQALDLIRYNPAMLRSLLSAPAPAFPCHRGAVVLTLWTFLASLNLVAQEPTASVRVITCGWNAPTLTQFARDVSEMQVEISSEISSELPLTGAVLSLHADSGNPNPLATAHGLSHEHKDWKNLDVQRSIDAFAACDQSRMPDNYLLLNSNPGDVDWTNDAGWSVIVNHYRAAARIAKASGMRGLLLDFEPYTDPHRQFQYSRQADAAKHPFSHYKTVTRKRGRQVMQAMLEEFPGIELNSYFLLSYLIDDHPYRGPSPAGRSDADWCLAGHSYGLLPAYLDGILDIATADVRLIDGCENAYWFKTEAQFRRCAQGVRGRAASLLSPENREKYRRQISVAFPIYLDAIHPTLAGRYTLQPERPDRLNLFRRNMAAAIRYGDGLVWLYGENGRWWPEAGDEALWKGKDTYPLWEEQLPGLSDALRQVVATSRAQTRGGERTAAAEVQTNPIQPEPGQSGREQDTKNEIGATVLDVQPQWETWNEGKDGSVTLAEGQVTLTGVTDASGLAALKVRPGRRYMVQTQVVQQGRGMTRMSIRWRTEDGKWLTSKKHDVISYPPDGDPTIPRTITAIATAPAGTTAPARTTAPAGTDAPSVTDAEPYTMVVICNATQQLDDQDAALFGNLMIGVVDETDQPATETIDTTNE